MAHKDSHNPAGQSNGQGNGQGNGGSANGQGNSNNNGNNGNAYGRSKAAQISHAAAVELSKEKAKKGGHASNITCMYCHEEGTHDAPLIKFGKDEFYHENHIQEFIDLNEVVFE